MLVPKWSRTMNAPDKFPKIPVARGVYLLRPAPARLGALRRRTAAGMLIAMQRAIRMSAGKSGRAFLKEIRDARHAR